MKAIVRLSICLLLLTISFGAPSALAVNKALSLDGDEDYVEVADSESLDISNGLTIEAWIQFNTFPSWFSPIVSKWDDISGGFRTYFLTIEGRRPRFDFSIDGRFNPENMVMGNIDLETNLWYHVAAVRNANQSRIYLNGIVVGENNNVETGAIFINNLPLLIGAGDLGGENRKFSDGLIDEVRIWNIARTQEEIRADMNQPIENPELLENLVGYWNFDDGTADDLSQYGNDGALQGDATIVESERAKVIFIPDDYPAIQDGIDAANPGDIVVVDPGVYNENIIISKDDIRLQGSGADVTTIDGGGSGSVVKMSGISDVTISGFTITNGLGDGQDYYGNDNGGGIAVYECSNITIQNNIITQNYATGGHADGGGILIAKSTAPIIIAGNRITDNHAQHWGGGISIQGTFDVRIDANNISDNDAGAGDGISLWEGDPAEGASAWLINNWIINNQGDGIYISDDCFALIGGNREEGNDIFGNTEYAVRNDSTNTIDATYNYWGTTVEVEIRDAIWDYYDDDSNGVVDYEPWIDGAHKKVFPFAQALSSYGIGDYVEVPDSDSLDVTDVITIESWIRLGNDSQTFLRKPDAYLLEFGSPDWGGSGRRVQFGVWAAEGGFRQLAESSFDLILGMWYHVAVVYDQNVGRIFINGQLDVEENTSGYTGNIAVSDNILTIGCWEERELFTGQADEVRIWNIARTQEEIQADMNQPLENPQLMPNLVGYWNFDDGTANDSTLNGNHGTREGDAEIVPLYGTWPPPKRGDVSGDNTVSAYDAALILRYVVGLIDEFPADSMVSPSAIETRDYELSLPKVETPAGEKIQVPISINDATGLLAGGITVRYDQTVLRAVDYASLKLLNGYYWKANTDLPGEVRFAFATTVVTTMGQGNLLMVEFEVLPDAEGEISPLILENVNLSNSRSITKIDGEVRVIPTTFALLQNFPNPFNPDTWLPYKLASASPVSISIYNAKGQLIRTLHLGYQNAGVYVTKGKAAYWDGKDNVGEKVASGVYFYTLRTGKFRTTRKMVILK